MTFTNKFSVLNEISDKLKTIKISDKPAKANKKEKPAKETAPAASAEAPKAAASAKAGKAPAPVVNAPPTNSLAAQKEALKKAAAAPAVEKKEATAAAVDVPAPEAAAPAVDGAVAPVEPAPVPEVPKQTLAEYEKEMAAKRFTVEKKAVRRVDPAAYAKLQVLNADPAPAAKKPAAAKPAEAPKKAAAPAPKAGGKAPGKAPAPAPAAKTAPKEKKEKVLSLGQFVADHRPRRGPRYHDANATEEAAPNVEDASKFPSL
jgi:hypothetical protein